MERLGNARRGGGVKRGAGIGSVAGVGPVALPVEFPAWAIAKSAQTGITVPGEGVSRIFSVRLG